MDDEIKIRRIRPYPPKSDQNGRSRHRNPGEDEEEEQKPAGDHGGPEPEVKEGHIDTRVSPL